MIFAHFQSVLRWVSQRQKNDKGLGIFHVFSLSELRISIFAFTPCALLYSQLTASTNMYAVLQAGGKCSSVA